MAGTFMEMGANDGAGESNSWCEHTDTYSILESIDEQARRSRLAAAAGSPSDAFHIWQLLLLPYTAGSSSGASAGAACWPRRTRSPSTSCCATGRPRWPYGWAHAAPKGGCPSRPPPASPRARSTLHRSLFTPALHTCCSHTSCSHRHTVCSQFLLDSSAHLLRAAAAGGEQLLVRCGPVSSTCVSRPVCDVTRHLA